MTDNPTYHVHRNGLEFTMSSTSILRDARLSRDARLMYAILAGYASIAPGSTAEVFPSQETLAAHLGCSRDSVRRYQNELVAAGVITVTPRYTPDGRQTSNLSALHDFRDGRTTYKPHPSTGVPLHPCEGVPRTHAGGTPAPMQHERETMKESQRNTYGAARANAATAPPDGDAEHEPATGNNPTPHTAVGVDLLPAWEPRTGGHIQDTETPATTTPAPDDQTDTPPAPKRSTKRGTRVPDTFPVTDAMRTWAASEGFTNLDLDRVTAEFVDYWRGVSGSKGVKLDWTATWRNRVRQVAAWSSTGARVGVQQPPRAQRVYQDVTNTTEWEWLGMTEAEYREAVADRERRQAELEARKAAEAQRKRDVLARAKAYVAGTAASV